MKSKIEKLPEEKLVYTDESGVGHWEKDKYALKINEIIDELSLIGYNK